MKEEEVGARGKRESRGGQERKKRGGLAGRRLKRRCINRWVDENGSPTKMCRRNISRNYMVEGRRKVNSQVWGGERRGRQSKGLREKRHHI